MKIFLATGMHRSGTSLLAKGLHQAGVHMGDQLIPADRSNPYGHWEDMPAVMLNEKILSHYGGTWHTPPATLDGPLGDHLGDRIPAYIRTRCEQSELWGMKDPRFCITWPAWLPYLRATGADLHVMAAWRTPEASARSLRLRDGIPVERGVELAVRYHEGLERLLEEVDRLP